MIYENKINLYQKSFANDFVMNICRFYKIPYFWRLIERLEHKTEKTQIKLNLTIGTSEIMNRERCGNEDN